MGFVSFYLQLVITVCYARWIP